MITQIPQFFDRRLCNYLIAYFHETDNRVKHQPGVEVVRLHEQMHSESIKKIHAMLSHYGKDNYGKGHYIQNFEIVRRTPGNIMGLHKDFKPHDHTMIVFLNDDYEGGECHIEGINVGAEVGKAVTFPGNQLEHGVNEIYGKARYVLTCWWSAI